MIGIGLSLPTVGSQSNAGRPSLDLNFLSGSMPADVTFTRASSATYVNSAGVLTQAATNIPRFDHDPVTLAATALLVEEARTNSIRNSTVTGATAGVFPTNWSTTTNNPGTVAASVTGTGTDNGVPYVDVRFSGTPAGVGSVSLRFEVGAQIVAASGETWTVSSYAKVQAGALGASTVDLAVDENTSAGAFVVFGNSTSLAVTGAALGTQRISYTRTLAGGGTVARIRPIIRLVLTGTTPVDVTLRIGAPQAELGAFATSWIPTTTAAVQRAADTAAINTLSPWYNAAAGTLAVEFQRTGLATGGLPRALALSDGTINNRIELLFSTNDQFDIVAGGVSQGPIVLGNGGTTLMRIAAAWALNDAAASLNGGAAVTDNTITLPTGISQIQIGNRVDLTAQRQFSGHIRRIRYWRTRRSNGELQSLTLEGD